MSMCVVCGSDDRVHRREFARRAALAIGLGLMAATAAPLRALADASDKPPPKPQNVVSPQEALDRLMDGNARYVNGLAKRHDFIAEREALVYGQNPYAGILSCADSRIAPEFAFDSARGDLFVCRVAGNFVNADNLASFEYGVDVLKTPLVMVLGHEACGAVKATIASVQEKLTLPGHLPSLVAALAPAVEAVANQPGDLLANATRENVRRNVEALKMATPIISAAVDEGRLQVVGGIYRLATGQVELLG
jgi:carbonic anhydrase